MKVKFSQDSFIIIVSCNSLYCNTVYTFMDLFNPFWVFTFNHSLSNPFDRNTFLIILGIQYPLKEGAHDVVVSFGKPNPCVGDETGLDDVLRSDMICSEVVLRLGSLATRHTSY